MDDFVLSKKPSYPNVTKICLVYELGVPSELCVIELSGLSCTFKEIEPKKSEFRIEFLGFLQGFRE